MSAVTAPAAHEEAHAHEVPYATQIRSNRLGLWLFMFSEIFLFGALFATRFVLWGNTRPDLSQEIGLLATAILLLSSFFMYRSEVGAAHGDRTKFLRSALLAALMIAFPLGILSAQSRGASQAVTNGIGALRAIPSLAIMAAMLPLIGVGFRPALIALTILAIPPMLINTQAGIMAVNPAITEAARGMGLSRWQIIGQVQLPLALPVIVTGVRIASVEVIASATLGAIIGAGCTIERSALTQAMLGEKVTIRDFTGSGSIGATSEVAGAA